MGEVLWTLFMHTRCDLRASSGWPTASMRPIVHPSFGVAWLAYTRGTCHDQIARAARGRESFMHHAENSCGNKKPNHHLSTDRCLSCERTCLPPDAPTHGTSWARLAALKELCSLIEGHVAMGRVTAEVRAERTCRSESMRRWDVARAGHERDGECLSHITTYSAPTCHPQRVHNLVGR